MKNNKSLRRNIWHKLENKLICMNFQQKKSWKQNQNQVQNGLKLNDVIDDVCSNKKKFISYA